MTPERWARIAALFERAHELSGDDRQHFLAGVSADDRREVEDLLQRAEKPAVPVQSDPRRLTGLRIGTRVGQYRIEEILGSGGQGCVYRGVHEEIGLEAAIKALPPQFAADPGRQERLRREGKALATLDDEGIARVHDIVTEGDELFLVTEYVRGTTLRQVLSEGPLPLRTAIEYGTQILRALAVAHARGIVHRDLKPENVMISPKGRVKLLDFGLARVLPRATDDTRALDSLSRDVVGTIAYMSPEQFRGPDVDHRSDLFSFGVLLYEAVSGVHPFGDPSSWSIVGHIERDEPTPLSHHRHGLPASLFDVLARCLRKRPDDRFQSADDLAEALRSVEAGPHVGASDAVRWWQFHQVAVSATYASMLYPAWVAFEVIGWRPAGLLLFFVALAAAVPDVALRLFLLFSWRHYREAFDEDWAWVGRVLLATDAAYVGLLLLAAVFVIVLGGKLIGLAVLLFVVGLSCAVGFLVIEPAAGRAAFGETRRRPRLGVPPRFGSGRLGA